MQFFGRSERTRLKYKRGEKMTREGIRDAGKRFRPENQ